MPFKNIAPWTKSNEASFVKALKRDKAKIGDAIKKADEDAARPKEERSPGPPDTKSVRKQEREAKKAAKEKERARKKEMKKLQDGKKKKKQQQQQQPKKRARGEGAEEGSKKKAKKDFEKESEEERFQRLSRNLQILLEDDDLNVPKICSTLEKLSGMTVSILQLTESGVGQVVKGLRKHAHTDIQAKAKACFGKWKESFKAGAAGGPPEAAAAGAQGNGQGGDA